MKAYEFAALVEGGDTTFKETLSLESGIYDGHGATLTLMDGIVIEGNGVTLKNFTICGSITVNGNDFTLENCSVTSEDTAIIVHGEHFICKHNKVGGGSTSIALLDGSRYCLVANNILDGDISVENSFNSSILFTILFHLL